MRASDRTARRRRGFTLIELLVVIAIIAVLVSLTAVGVFRLIGTQQSANTKSELSRLEGEMQKQYRSAVAKFQIEPIAPTGQMNAAYNYVQQSMANNDPKLARVIWIKVRLKQTFPNSFNEALNPVPMPALPYYQSILSAQGYTIANTTVAQPWESGACLLLALGRAEDGGGVKVEDLGVNSFIHDFGPTPSGGTVKGLIDGWGTTLTFARWPVNSVVLNPPNGQPLAKDNNDPVDPSGLLESTTWQGTAGYGLFQTLCHAVPAHPGGEATSYRIYPLLASPGPDKLLGLNPTTFAATNAAQAADNLYPTLAPAQ